MKFPNTVACEHVPHEGRLHIMETTDVQQFNDCFTEPCLEKDVLNPLKPELNPICYLLALLGAHHFLHVSRIRVKLLTLR